MKREGENTHKPTNIADEIEKTPSQWKMLIKMSVSGLFHLSDNQIQEDQKRIKIKARNGKVARTQRANHKGKVSTI